MYYTIDYIIVSSTEFVMCFYKLEALKRSDNTIATFDNYYNNRKDINDVIGSGGNTIVH